jgi:hypothetical protein
MLAGGFGFLKVQLIRGGPQISDSMLRWLPPIQPKDRSNVKTTYFSAEFKARVALEALSGAHTMAELKELHAKIGQLTVENDFLSKAFGR